MQIVHVKWWVPICIWKQDSLINPYNLFLSPHGWVGLLEMDTVWIKTFSCLNNRVACGYFWILTFNMAHRITSPLLSCSTVFSVHKYVSRFYFSFFCLFNFILRFAGTEKYTIRQVLFFYLLSLGLVVWPRWGDPFVSQLLLSSFYFLRAFRISVSTGVWVTTSLLKTPGLGILADLNNAVVRKSPPVPLFPSPLVLAPILVPILWWLYQYHKVQLV